MRTASSSVQRGVSSHSSCSALAELPASRESREKTHIKQVFVSDGEPINTLGALKLQGFTASSRNVKKSLLQS